MARAYLFILLSFAIGQSFAQSLAGVVNDYIPVLSYDSCGFLIVQSSTAFSVGDRVLIIQMQGAQMDVSNTGAYGDILNRNHAGNYEFNNVSSISGNVIGLTHFLDRLYDFQNGRVQLIRVASFNTAVVSGVVTAGGWNGLTGGVIAIECSDSLILNADVNASELGFEGGGVFNQFCAYGNSDYHYSLFQSGGATKGHGVAVLPSTGLYTCGKGANSNGGGGGNGHNRGGGGGGNAGAGGQGGSKVGDPTQGEGVGGKAIDYLSYGDVICLGGGGGAGDTNQNDGTDGGTGGAIVFIRATTLVGNGHAIRSNGADVLNTANLDAAGGGGAGGSIFLEVADYSNTPVNVEVTGGRGGDNGLVSTNSNNAGTGGGGGGGIIRFVGPILPTNVQTSVVPGDPGLNTYAGSNLFGTPYGAAPGLPGSLQSTSGMYFSSIPVNVQPLQITAPIGICAGDVVSLSVAATAPLTWSTGDTSATIQVSNPGVYWVSHTGSLACSPSDTIYLHDITPVVDLGPDTTICMGDTLLLQNSFMNSLIWSTGDTSSTLAVPSASAIWAFSDSLGCIASDSIQVSIAQPFVSLPADTSLCPTDSLSIYVPSTYPISWSTGDTNATITIPSVADTIWVSTGTVGCLATDTIIISVSSLAVDLGPDSSICSGDTITLSVAPGMDFYNWSTGGNGHTTSIYSGQTVSIEVGLNGCVALDTMVLSEIQVPLFSLPPDTTICPDDSLLLTSPVQAPFIWSNGSLSTQVQFPSATSLWLTAGIAPCESIDSMVIFQHQPLTDSLPGSVVICSGDSIELALANTYPSYAWSTGDTAASIWVSSQGMYSTIIFDGVCHGQFNTELIVQPLDTGSFISEVLLDCFSGNVELVPTNLQIPVSLTWANGDTSASIVAQDVGVQWLTIEGECLEHVWQFVVAQDDCDYAVYVPNAFTPDGDGINDHFLPVLSGDVQLVEFLIFNRWGELIHNTLNAWDGTYQNARVQDGVYSYRVKTKSLEPGVQLVVGHVSVVR